MVNNYSTKILSKLMHLNILNRLDLDINEVKIVDIEDDSVGELSEVNFDMDLANKSISANMAMILRCKRTTGGLVEILIKSSGSTKCDIKYIRLVQNLVYIFTRDYILNNINDIPVEVIPMNLHRCISGDRSYTRKDGALTRLKNLIDFNHFNDNFKLLFRR